MIRIIRRAAVALAAAAILLLDARTAHAQAFQVVVNATNPVTTLSKAQVADLFFRRAAKFPAGGKAAVPVDQDATAKPRLAFSRAIFGRDAGAMETYWQQQIFAGGDAPPAKHKSDDAVLAFVRATPGAIGYVGAGTALGAGVKSVAVSGL
jgi:ABC-type phosphate transport system substrate-binding protein